MTRHEARDPRIFRYVVRHDGGVAPRPFDGLCSLAICKPKIRAAACVGDWIIGFRTKRPGEVTYVMQVTERVTFAEYWNDPRFRGRRPGASAYPDNIYRPGRVGRLTQVPNPVHDEDSHATDTGGRFVLLSNRFWYFGIDSVPIPNQLVHLVHAARGHAVNKARRPGDVAALEAWLAAWPTGMHGLPSGAKLGVDHSGTGKSTRVGSTAAVPAAVNAVRARCGSTQRRLPVAKWNLILSRKGFDSVYGGMPSPILPDGRLLPLPIPVAHDRHTMGDLHGDRDEIGALLADLSGGRHSLATRIHLDPDLDRAPHLRLPGWRPALGQSGAAQTHLAGRGVGPGDVFLFFGWFREVERASGAWRYIRSAPHLHVLFGWLEVGDVLPVVTERQRCLELYPWIADHPHVADPSHYNNPRNSLYIAAPRSQIAAGPAGGMFKRFDPALQLTVPGASRSVWDLPAWFMAAPGQAPLSCHGNPSRWQRRGNRCHVQSVPIGQEFVLAASERKHARSWVTDLIRKSTQNAYPRATSRT